MSAGLWVMEKKLLQDRASARAFSEPGKWTADNAILDLTVINCRQ